MTPESILKKFWGYDSFRPKQKEIIQHALAGNDTIALLTTGGGKSLCYQVPALLMDGVTLVISPLIALMKDQVDSLRDKGISAEAIYSGRSYRDLDRILDNAVYGHLKLLYLSPERLMSELVVERIKAMKLSLVAVDEAHCISQWGYDFRPAYMHIAAVKEWHPATPFMALTATATKKVAQDIREKLELKSPQTISTSFERPELSIKVQSVEAKQSALLRIFNNNSSSSIVYVYSRKDTKIFSDHLRRHGITADYYHAGLTQKERGEKQAAWMTNKTSVIVCTNAFGMGIDKPDVRRVIHLHIPSSIENYYQEIGRAGRDGHASEAILLYYEPDKEKLIERINKSFPPISSIRRIYEALGGYLDLAVGGGQYDAFDFDLMDFSKKMNFDLLEVHHALKVLEREAYVQLSEQRWQSSSVWINQSSRSIQTYIQNHPKMGIVLNALLRMYQTIGQQHTFINEGAVARYTNIEFKKIVSGLSYLDKEGILEYRPRKEKPQITFMQDRVSSRNLSIDHKHYILLKERRVQGAKAILNYIDYPGCRQLYILKYFGESSQSCGNCDHCISKRIVVQYPTEIISAVKLLPRGSELSPELVTDHHTITYLLDEEIIRREGQNYIKQ